MSDEKQGLWKRLTQWDRSHFYNNFMIAKLRRLLKKGRGEEILEKGTLAVPALCEIVNDYHGTGHRERITAIGLLGEVGDPRAAHVLTRMLRFEYHVTQQAVVALGEIAEKNKGDERLAEAVPYLFDRLAQYNWGDTNEQISQTLTSMQNIAVPELVHRYIETNEKYNSTLERKYLRQIDRSAAFVVPYVIEQHQLGRISDKNAILLLGYCGRIEALDYLLGLFKHEKGKEERTQIVWAIASIARFNQQHEKIPEIARLVIDHSLEEYFIWGTGVDKIEGLGKAALPILEEHMPSLEERTSSPRARDKYDKLNLLIERIRDNAVKEVMHIIHSNTQNMRIGQGEITDIDEWYLPELIHIMRTKFRESEALTPKTMRREVLRNIGRCFDQLETEDKIYYLLHKAEEQPTDSGIIDMGEAAIPVLVKIACAKNVLSERSIALIGAIGGDKAVEALARVFEDQLASGDRSKTKAIIEALGNTKSERAIPILIDFLSNWSLRIEVYEALKKLGEPALKKLVEELRKNQDQSSQSSLREAIHQFEKVASPHLLEILDEVSDEDFQPNTIGVVSCTRFHTYHGAIKLLGEIREEKAVPRLLELIDYFVEGSNQTNECKQLAAECVRALGRIRDAQAVEKLIELLDYDDYREVAAIALGDIGDPRAAEPLTKCIRQNIYMAGLINAVGKLGQLSSIPVLFEVFDDVKTESVIVAIVDRVTKRGQSVDMQVITDGMYDYIGRMSFRGEKSRARAIAKVRHLYRKVMEVIKQNTKSRMQDGILSEARLRRPENSKTNMFRVQRRVRNV